MLQKNEVALTERWILPATAENFAPQDLFPFGGNGVSKASRYFQDHAGEIDEMQQCGASFPDREGILLLHVLLLTLLLFRHAGHQVPHMQHKLQHQASYLVRCSLAWSRLEKKCPFCQV